MRAHRWAAAAILWFLTLSSAGCGTPDHHDGTDNSSGTSSQTSIVDLIRQATAQAPQQIKDETGLAPEQAKPIIDQLRQQMDQTSDAVPAATDSSGAPATQGTETPQTMDDFLTTAIQNVDDYWTKTLETANLPTPQVTYKWLAPGEVVDTSCGSTDDMTAMYCAADDEIYFSQGFAYNLWQGTALPPGQNEIQSGDFGVAYVVAHEYAHNIQTELGIGTNRPDLATVKPFELQADCLAGGWASSVYDRGVLTSEDVQRAISTAHEIGEFDTNNPMHHGTPDERAAAWYQGFSNASPRACTALVPPITLPQ